MLQCPICQAEATSLREVDDVEFFCCTGCGSLFAHPDFLAAVDDGTAENYRDTYWAKELASARERSWGAGIVRVAEILRLSRIPVRRFLDIGCGPGFLLDSLAGLLPSTVGMFHGVELFPPPLPHRSAHPNYHIGTIAALTDSFDAGLCMEVIEHMTPTMLADMARQLAARSNPGALYFFNSAQPSFVQTIDPDYLDPKKRGHVVSWSLAGARKIFGPAGFSVIPLPGRDWAFLAEFGPAREISADDLLAWLWQPVPENLALMQRDAYGSLLATTGLESARCYLEHSVAVERTQWALSLDQQVQELRRSAPENRRGHRSWLSRLTR